MQLTSLRNNGTGVAAILLLCAVSHAETKQVADQFRAYCLHESTGRGERLLDDVELPRVGIAQALKLLETMKPDGSWADVDYSSNARSSWPASGHLTRALGLTVYACRADTSPAEAARCFAGVHKALAFWEKHDYQCPNWWNNQIGVPKILGTIALLLTHELTPQEKTYITDTVLARSKIGAMTGQNRVWLAGNGVMRAALLSDEAMMREAAGVIQEELRVGTTEGIQPDWSFHQHGPQQQFGNYGMAYAVEMTRWVTVLRGTPWAFSPEKIAILRNYLLEGENWVIWRDTMDISACGRQLFPGSPVSKAGVVRGAMLAMAVADADHAKEYAAFVARNAEGEVGDRVNDLVGDHYFWRSDYLVHRRADWMATLKMSSTRVIGGETVNSENLSGLHLADGATFFYRSGQEYQDIFPAWDWRMIPGVTSGLTDGSLQWPKADLKKASAFVGAVSDGMTTLAAMDFHREDVHAKKTWFFENDRVICLGTDIHSAGSEEVVTTINQCLLHGTATVQRDGHKEILNGAVETLASAQSVDHDGWRYRVLESDLLKASAGPATGNWKTVFMSPATPKADVTKNEFTLWISHGKAPTSGTYAYSVEPLTGQKEDQTVNESPVNILSNTGRLQAVKTKEWTGATFWTEGTANVDGIPIHVNAPCLLLIIKGHIRVSDPTEKLVTFQVEVAGKSYEVILPQGGESGKSAEIVGAGFP